MESNDKVIERLDEIRDKVDETNSSMLVHIAESQKYMELTDKHERQLNGTNGRKALMSRTDRLEDKIEDIQEELNNFKSNVSKVLWALATIYLIALGRGLLNLIVENLG